MTTVLRLSLAFCLLVAAALPTRAEDTDALEWERGESSKSVVYANLESKKSELFGFFCRPSKNGYVGGIVMRVPSFRILLQEGEPYSLNIVIDGIREGLTLKAKDIDLWYEATDLNQQLNLARIFDSVRASHQVELAISSVGWRARFTYENAATALDGLMAKCL